ncbi:MAG: hypothetical protein K2N50_05480 [Clostridia bacterium]|nr:hypothetical protein [Clostridia bacterium]
MIALFIDKVPPVFLYFQITRFALRRLRVGTNPLVIYIDLFVYPTCCPFIRSEQDYLAPSEAETLIRSKPDKAREHF